MKMRSDKVDRDPEEWIQMTQWFGGALLLGNPFIEDSVADQVKDHGLA